MKILFVCKYNRFRSRVAEGIFNKLNANSELSCSSAGILLDESRPYVCENVKSSMKSFGYDLYGDFRLVSSLNLNNYNKIVVVADNVDKSSFVGFDGEVVVWNVLDCAEDDLSGIQNAIKNIESKVEGLLEDLSLGN